MRHIPSSPRTAFAIGPLPQGYEHAGPDAHENTTCKCSTVVYSLLSACDACQGSGWFRYVSHPPLAFWAYLIVGGMIIRPIAQLESRLPHRESTVVVRGFLALTENIISVSLILSLKEPVCPIGRLLTSQFVIHLSSSLHTDRISQVQGTWNSSQSYAVGGRNASFSVTQPHSSSTLPFSDRPEVPPGAIINSGTWK
jgi:hypothetical protein